KKSFFVIVTPDIQLELVCNEFVVIEKDPTDVIYSTQNELLGMYGVVAAASEMYTSKDLHNHIIHPQARVLVPVVVGEAREPFINSRVNLERARLMISTVPDGETVRAVFERAVQSRIRSIVCIGHSDQISYLTYRARHHPVVLVYPRHNQGNTLGHRMWATMLKVRAIQKMKNKKWPNVLIIGNNKANRFMIETIWAYLPGKHENRTDIVQKHFAFIVTPGEESIGYPILEAGQPKKGAFDLYWPESFITSGRFPYPVKRKKQLYPLRLKTRMVNDVDTRALIECISEHKPHIILINHDRMESGARMLLRCMRAIERLRIRIKNFHMPIILLSSAQADEKEHLILGDASRYYDALCRLYDEPLVTDNRYPGHSRYDHYIREVIGETITDSLSDAEEMIIGAIKAFHEPITRGIWERVKSRLPRQQQEKSIFDFSSEGAHFIEVSSCLPNRPGTLANYLATLANLNFSSLGWKELKDMWDKELRSIWPNIRKTSSSKRSKPNQSSTIESFPMLPSFQYLRHLKLDTPNRNAFALTGYATLVPVKEESPFFQVETKNESLVVRIFANDGRNYVEREMDPMETLESPGVERIQKRWEIIKEPSPPGVPQVINEVARRDSEVRNTIREYKQVLLGNFPNHTNHSVYACPGMNNCRIAAFQDYINASNNLRLSTGFENEELWHARNYYCCTNISLAESRDLPTPNSHFARIFCCAHTRQNRPGLIASILNVLVFRSFSSFNSSDSKNWQLNIEYFKHITCQNSYFSVNRLFGTLHPLPKQKSSNAPPDFPMHLLRILPVGGIESAKHWYAYGWVLWKFLKKEISPDFRFSWINGCRESLKVDKEKFKHPSFDENNPKEYPIAIMIKKP
ncbi:MAG: hypothetical protein D6748_00320, partial [Calditrichaeota bacterium]